MKAARIALVAALLCGGAALYAKPAPRPSAPSPQELVTTRQAGMDMAAATLTLLKNASNNGAPLKSLAFPASGLAKFAGVMPALFADNTKGLPSRSRPSVWTDRAGFQAKAGEFAAATKALAAAAAAEDKAAFDTALASVGASCKGCHETYQVPPPAAKPG
ncbi:cytochrome c [Novosphingobium sp.]|uniref:cytochrome c n=1 Tax=Novosphingobium sp. TaxID=1874826 RepID=UPI0025E9D707|nr:cytochrome c [Novosphingobium sp.]MCC6925170.1 cytochrome c [Novosphingobium sp.]